MKKFVQIDAKQLKFQFFKEVSTEADNQFSTILLIKYLKTISYVNSIYLEYEAKFLDFLKQSA